ncbi:MAG: hypothetical protein PUP92_06005 [Rhizonema sp. PD38]|nr:hypothetical protein [Rhizonema sp. PD38]
MSQSILQTQGANKAGYLPTEVYIIDAARPCPRFYISKLIKEMRLRILEVPFRSSPLLKTYAYLGNSQKVWVSLTLRYKFARVRSVF